ncbi:MAG: hypothetical protein ISS28_04565, partial [Candidatus Cloacimonetes bacterium]|nr:hypothetical protein [Candidatus Cloacimonadota bacterium]
MKKIMILGAGYNQLPAIKKAVELGLYVITVDYLPDNIGHKYSHRYVNCSTTDRECVLKYATELKIDGIMTLASDVATTTVAYVAEKLGINGSGYEIAKIMSNKSLFRSFQKKNKLAHPGFIYGKDYLKIEKEVVSLK